LALSRTARGISAPLGLAALAVAVGFLSFVPTDYQGVSELGLIAGTSMIIALLANLTVLPALLAVLPARSRPEATGFAWAAAPDRWLHHNARLVLGAGLLAAAASCAAIPSLRFDADPLDLQNPKTPAVATALDLVNNPETAPNIDLLLPNLTAAAALGDRLEKLPEVRQVLSLASFVPDDQPEKLDAIEQMQLFLGPVLDPGNKMAPPDAAAERAATDHFEQHLTRFLAGPAGPALAQPGQHLADALRRFLGIPDGGDVRQLRQILLGGFPGRIAALQAAMTAGKLSVETMPPEFKADWVAADGQARLAVFPKGNTRDPATLGRFVDAVRRLAPDATGDPILVLETGRTVSRAFATASAYALLGITLVLILFLRRPLEVMLVIIPLILAALYTLGASVLVGIAFNYANIIAIPLLMGIGVAFDIYFVMLWRAGGEKIALLQTPTARAVVFSAGTTATAFGSLALSHHVGTASMGILLIIALFFVLVSTLLVQPALMTLAARLRR
jgi:hopanoid biosynthesis associated RND transporter like protein HpnN